MDLNICEAHAFNTNDRLVLDVFVVNGWQGGVRGVPTVCTADYVLLLEANMYDTATMTCRAGRTRT